MLPLLFVKLKKKIVCVRLLLKGDTVKPMKNPHVLQRRGGERGGWPLVQNPNLPDKNSGCSEPRPSALALPAAAKISGRCQAELAAHLPVLLLHLQELCPHAVNCSHVQLMIASRRRGGGGLPSVTPPAPLVACRPTTASSPAVCPFTPSFPPCTDVSSRH